MPNLHQDLINQAQQVAEKSSANNNGSRYTAQALVYVIESNGRLEEAINRFNKATEIQSKETKNLSSAQVSLAKAQVFLGKVGIIIAILAVLVAIGLRIWK